MTRDSLFGDEVVWSGKPQVFATPAPLRWAAVASGVIAGSSALSTIAASTMLHAPAGSSLIFSLWMATLALAFWRLPIWWRSGLEVQVTETSVILRRGRYRRFVDRRAISFARIHWYPGHAGVGDLELVRAVPMGAMMRRISMVIPGVAAPDRVWAVVRGRSPSALTGDGPRLLSQRLDEGERVLWSAHPAVRWRAWLPRDWRSALSTVLGLSLGIVAAITATGASHALGHVLGAGAQVASGAFFALALGVGSSVALLVGAALGIVYASLVKPVRLDSDTRYLITDQRVLIQRGLEELHLDRSRIVDVIDAPRSGKLRDLFLVLDGPRARALAVSGGFGGEAGTGLQPVLRWVEDADGAERILRSSPAGAAA